MRLGKFLLIMMLSLTLTACGQAEDMLFSGSDDVSNESTVSQEIQFGERSAGEMMETVFFGNYPQNAETAELIEWIILDIQDDRVLLLAKNCIDSLTWHNAHESITWAHCDLRAWLNGEFMQTSFTAQEQERILLSDLDNSDAFGYGTPVGENTQDKVFLLSTAEVEKYLPEASLRTVKPTEYAISHGAYANANGDCAWWLRSLGMTETSPAYLSSGGSFGSRSHEVNETIIGVRPAVWVQCEAPK